MRRRLFIPVLLLSATVLMAACTTSVEVSQPAIAAADRWTETTSTYSTEFRAVAQSVSPDGRWLATASRSVCLYELGTTSRPLCAEEETVGSDSLDWDPDSSRVTPGGSASGRWNATGVWTVDTGSSTTEVSPVDAGSVVTGEVNVLDVGMAFRPDGDSIVFVQVDLDADTYQLLEVDVDGRNQVRIADLDGFFWSSLLPVVPLGDDRVLLTDGQIGEPVLVLFDGGNRTVLTRGIERDTPGLFPKPPVVVEATETGGGFALVSYPGVRDARGLNTDRTRWSLFNFEGDEFPLTKNDEWQIATATLSPDGSHIAFVRADLPGTEDPQAAVVGEVYVTTVDAIVAGEPELDSRVLQADATSMSRAATPDPGFITWTPDNRLLIAPPANPGFDITIIEIDLSPAAGS